MWKFCERRVNSKLLIICIYNGILFVKIIVLPVNWILLEEIWMKKTVILVLLATLSILGLILPQPEKTVISLLILIPLTIYIIADIVKHGNK